MPKPPHPLKPATVARNERVFLGFAICDTIARRGVSMPGTAIAAATGLTRQRIEEIENRALRKLRRNLPQLASLKTW